MLGDDAGNKPRRGDIERRVPDLCPLGCELHPAQMRDLLRGALLDRNAGPILGGQVDCGYGRRYIERHLVFSREDRHSVGSDLVGDIAVGSNPVGTDHHDVDPSGLHQRADHSVRDHSGLDAFTDQFPCREPSALQKRTGLVCVHGHPLARFDCRADHPERRPEAPGGQRTRVAMGEHTPIVWQYRRAVPPQRPAIRHILVVNTCRLGVDRRLQFIGRLTSPHRRGEHALHPLNRPEQVDGGRSCRPQQVTRPIELRSQLRRARRRAAAQLEGHTHRRRDTDGRRTADHHGPDRLGHVPPGATSYIHLPRRQLSLVNHDDLAVFPVDGG